VEEWSVWRWPASDVLEQAKAERWQDFFKETDILLFAHIDMDVEFSVKIKADRGISGADLDQDGQYPVQLIGHNRRWLLAWQAFYTPSVHFASLHVMAPCGSIASL
jgi:hypothetical protein